MPQGPDALKHLAPNWFASVMGLAGLSLAWGRAEPILGEMAGAGALVLAAAAALLFVALAVLSWIRWQHYPEAVAGDMKHPVRHGFIATLPVSLILVATVAASLFGDALWVRGLWWLGSLTQFGVTLWVLARWLGADKAQHPGWAALTPALMVPGGFAAMAAQWKERGGEPMPADWRLLRALADRVYAQALEGQGDDCDERAQIRALLVRYHQAGGR